MGEHTIGNFTKVEADALRANLKTAMRDQTKATVFTASMLYSACYGVIRDASGADVPIVLAWGHDDFDEYAEHELQMHMTAARGLVVLYEELYAKRKFPEGTLPDSITKLRQLTRVAKKCGDERKLKSWIGKSHDMSCCEFELAVEEEFGEGRRMKRLGFALKFSHYNALLKRLRVARDSFGTTSNGEALIKMADEWAEMHESRDRVRRKRA